MYMFDSIRGVVRLLLFLSIDTMLKRERGRENEVQ